MKTTLDDCMKQVGRATERFPWENPQAYGDWLAQTYFYVCHSTRLLAAAAARFPYDERGNILHHRFAAHMAEEKKHELLCIHDLKKIGSSIEAHSEHHSTRSFYEVQYYKIEHKTPLALFGYILPLEAVGPMFGLPICDRLVKAYGEKSESFMRVHSEDDVEHIEKAFEMLKSVTPREQAYIEENIRQTAFGYISMLEDIKRHLDVSPG
jgi:pyrroloquinoline quinone (PQQ) biosynthesis protein C